MARPLTDCEQSRGLGAAQMEWPGQATPKAVWEPWEVWEGAGYQVGSHCRGCGSMRCVVLSLWRPLRPVETIASCWQFQWGGLQLGSCPLSPLPPSQHSGPTGAGGASTGFTEVPCFTKPEETAPSQVGYGVRLGISGAQRWVVVQSGGGGVGGLHLL